MFIGNKSSRKYTFPPSFDIWKYDGETAVCYIVDIVIFYKSPGYRSKYRRNFTCQIIIKYRIIRIIIIQSKYCKYSIWNRLLLFINTILILYLLITGWAQDEQEFFFQRQLTNQRSRWFSPAEFKSVLDNQKQKTLYIEYPRSTTHRNTQHTQDAKKA